MVVITAQATRSRGFKRAKLANVAQARGRSSWQDCMRDLEQVSGHIVTRRDLHTAVFKQKSKFTLTTSRASASTFKHTPDFNFAPPTHARRQTCDTVLSNAMCTHRKLRELELSTIIRVLYCWEVQDAWASAWAIAAVSKLHQHQQSVPSVPAFLQPAKTTKSRVSRAAH